jgi:hypothetical protein
MFFQFNLRLISIRGRRRAATQAAAGSRAPGVKLSAPSNGMRALLGLPPKDDPLPKPPVPGVKDSGLKPLLGAFADGVVLELPPAIELHAGRTVTC